MTETLDNNGIFAGFVISGGTHKELPETLLSWLDGYVEGTNGLVHVLKNISHPKKRGENKEFTILFTFNICLDPDTFEDYADALVIKDMFPIIKGHGMKPRRLKFYYVIPQPYKKLGQGLYNAELDITIEAKELSICLETILADVFNISYDSMKHVASSIHNDGFLYLPKCLKESDVPKIDYIMNKFNIKYELDR